MRNRLHIAICDDEKQAASIISASVEASFANGSVDVIIDTFLSANELLKQLEDETYNLMFLDINMPEMDGILLGKKIKDIHKTTELIFVSSNVDRVFDTFDIHPFGFVRKNNFMTDLNNVIERYIQDVVENNDYSSIIQFKQHGGIIAIRVSNLKYVECIRNMQMLYTDNDAEPKKIYSRMEALESQLAQHGFIRVHKGFLVNYLFIQRFDSKIITLTSGEEIPVSRTKSRIAMDEYMNLISHDGGTKIGC
ncbi:MAG: LytTR family DNA-binding domain-containing protein [Lachnospiraceae bacterium]|nr:LytTR family DNA-binding domain-containing protein [Lachnospiraceae bacterium]